MLKNKPSLDIHTIEGDVLTITMAETADKARDNYKTVGGAPTQMTNYEFQVKLNAEAHIDELAQTAIFSNVPRTPDTKNHLFAKDGFTYRTAYFKDFDGKYYQIRLSIGHNGTKATVYNVGKIKESIPPSAKIIAVVGSQARSEMLSNNSIPETSEKNNPSDEFSRKFL